jgi:hypothetical protein
MFEVCIDVDNVEKAIDFCAEQSHGSIVRTSISKHCPETNMIARTMEAPIACPVIVSQRGSGFRHPYNSATLRRCLEDRR